MHDNSKPARGLDSTWAGMITFGMSSDILSTATKTLWKTEFVPGRDPRTVQIRQPLEVMEQPELYSVFAPEARSMLADSSHPLYSRSEPLSYRRWERIPLAAKNVFKKKKNNSFKCFHYPELHKVTDSVQAKGSWAHLFSLSEVEFMSMGRSWTCWSIIYALNCLVWVHEQRTI